MCRPPLPDHHRQLALEIEVVRELGADHLALVRNERVGKADEHARLFWQVAPHLCGVGFVVHTGAKDLPRVRNDRQKTDVRQLVIGLRILRGLANLVERARCERIAQRLVAADRHHTVADDHTEAFRAAGDIACEFHEANSVNRAFERRDRRSSPACRSSPDRPCSAPALRASGGSARRHRATDRRRTPA